MTPEERWASRLPRLPMPDFGTVGDAAEWWLRRGAQTERAVATLRADLDAWRAEHGVEAPGLPGLVEFQRWRANRKEA